MNLPPKPANTDRRIELTAIDVAQCTRCDGRGITEKGEDDYGSYYSIKCRHCFLGMIVTKHMFNVRENQNGTFTIV